MDAKVEKFYRNIFNDLAVDHEEANDLVKFFDSMNPPPDKLVWLRSTAFRLGCEFLSDNPENNVALLRAINAIVHSLEKTCMMPKKVEDYSDLDNEKVEEFYKNVYSDIAVDQDENSDLFTFFQQNTPPADDLVTLRATAFKAATDLLNDDKEHNSAILRCVNAVVNAFERTCLVPKQYELKLQPDFDLNVTLSEAIQQMWDLDLNRLRPGVDYKLNVQEGKKPSWKEDKADDPLFAFVDSNALKRPTYAIFVSLLDNYNAAVGAKESFAQKEQQESWTFLKAIMQSAPMQFCHKYLLSKGVDGVTRDSNDFMKLLYKIWFEHYNRQRGGPLDSSGFEHVFVGEVKGDSISGLHNWIQFYLEEKKGALDYRGYIKPRSVSETETDSNDHVLTLQFHWHGVEKLVGTSFIGVSPEFEFAIYTTCFLLGEEDNEIVLKTETDEFHLKIRCYKMAHDKIGTAFPEATAHYD